MRAVIIIGKNFGDEGKGLAADCFASRAAESDTVCVRHNGGAQAGHTVDFPGKRFVFSQLSSASFRGADTYWADSFLPDLYKLSAETSAFRALLGNVPRIFASPDCRCTYIGDILLNMLLETSRGKNRHGSCGMGINEAVVRSVKYPLHLGELAGQDAETVFRKYRQLQKEYLPQRLAELHLDLHNAGEYGEMLQSEEVLRNAAEQTARNAETVRLTDASILRHRELILFEGAQGLLLDECNTEYAPHLTSSRTGLTEPARLLRTVFGETLPETEIVYVTRSYVTRHGAGPLPDEYLTDPPAYGTGDKTNLQNEWQGAIRTAPHGNPEDFTKAVRADLAESALPGKVSLFVTHLNESDGCMVTKNGNIPLAAYCAADAVRSLFSGVYRSATPYAADVRYSVN